MYYTKSNLEKQYICIKIKEKIIRWNSIKIEHAKDAAKALTKENAKFYIFTKSSTLCIDKNI